MIGSLQTRQLGKVRTLRRVGLAQIREGGRNQNRERGVILYWHEIIRGMWDMPYLAVAGYPLPLNKQRQYWQTISLAN